MKSNIRGKSYSVLIFFLILGLCSHNIAYSQHWIRTYGGNADDYAYSLQQTGDDVL